jgi:hypothetical protein
MFCWLCCILLQILLMTNLTHNSFSICLFHFSTFIFTNITVTQNFSLDSHIYVLLTVLHLATSPVNDQLDTQFFFYMFISLLYMFRANLCSSSGESIVSIQQMVCVTLCRWPSSMQVGKEDFLPDLRTRRSEWHIPDVVLIQLILLMMNTSLLETCRELK